MKFTKVGMRTIKTVIAVIITLAISEIFNLRSPVLAAIAVIMTMEPSVSESISTAKYRMYGTILGGIIALIITAIAPGNFLVIGLGLIIIINLCNVFQWEKAARMSMVVFLVIILDYSDGQGFSYAINRTLDTLVGVLVSTAINYFIRPPKTEENIRKTIDDMYIEVKVLIERLIWENTHGDLENLRQEIIITEDNYKVFIDDLRFNIKANNNILDYFNLLDSFENLHTHLSIVNSLNERPYINEKNREFLEDYFHKKIPKQEERELNTIDIIYNYHLEKILNELKLVEKLMEENM